MAYSINTKEGAISLRKRGYSVKEVAAKLNIAQSTSSIWLRNITLSSKAQNRLKSRRIFGQYKSRLIKIKKGEDQRHRLFEEAKLLLTTVKHSRELSKLCCSLLYWCEGNKNADTMVRFTNSDPSLVKTFLSLLRDGFGADESKFRVLMHLHKYHNEEKQKKFWNQITDIPLSQFNRTYWKPNTGKNKHKNYPGCIAISYYDARVAKELIAIYNTFAQRGVG